MTRIEMNKKLVLILLTILMAENLKAQIVKSILYNGSEKETLILLPNYVLVDTLTFTKKVKSPSRKTDSIYSLKMDIVDKHFAYFLKQLLRPENTIIKVTDFFYSLGDNWDTSTVCYMKARMYSTKDYVKFKEHALKEISPWYKKDTNISYVVIYRPNYTHSLVDIFQYSLKVNDTIVNIHSSSKYILKFNQDTTINIGISDIGFHQVFNVSRGNTYYVRCDAIAPMINPSGNGINIALTGYLPRVKLLDNEIIGVIESDKIKNTR